MDIVVLFRVDVDFNSSRGSIPFHYGGGVQCSRESIRRFHPIPIDHFRCFPLTSIHSVFPGHLFNSLVIIPRG